MELAGTPREMGIAHGESVRQHIHGLYAARIANAIEQARTYGGRSLDEAGILSLSERCLPVVRGFHPDGFEELVGIAEGANLTPVQVWAMNALTDLRDLAAFADLGAPDGLGCSSFIVMGDRTEGSRRYCGQTWDLGTDNKPFVIMVRRTPSAGPETVCLTTTGCLSLIGLNAYGVAVGTTNLRSYDARFGVGYLDVIHKALNAPTAAEARTVIEEAPRTGAHYYYAVDRSDAWAIECTATRHATVDFREGAYVHCNHFLDERHRSLEVTGTPVASTHARQARLTELLTAAERPLTAADLRAALGDAHGGENAISRHDFGGISTNGAVLMSPEEGTLWAVHGPAEVGTWTRFRAGAHGARPAT